MGPGNAVRIAEQGDRAQHLAQQVAGALAVHVGLQALLQVQHRRPVARDQRLHQLFGLRHLFPAHLLLQLRPLSLQASQPLAQRRAVAVLGHGIHQARQLLLHLGQALAAVLGGRAGAALMLGYQGPGSILQMGYRAGVFQLFAHDGQHSRVQRLARHDVVIRACGGPAILAHAAAVPAGVHGHHGAAAGRADHHAAEQRAGWLAGTQGR